MGNRITKENLAQLYRDYEAGKSKLQKIKPKIEYKMNIKDFFKKNLTNCHKKIEKLNQVKNNNNDYKNEDEKINKEINRKLCKRHKSFDLFLKKRYLEDFTVNYKYYKKRNESTNDDSNNSDYEDISNKKILINRTKNIQKNKIKSIKLRNDYITRLITSNILKFEKERKVNNLFFFDWDDTLMCTSYLAPTGSLEEEEGKQIDKNTLKNLDFLVSSLLNKSLENGEVFIVTNAAYGWIEYSARKLYPSTTKLLKKIKIISARGIYQKKLPGDYRQWKSFAFIDTVMKYKIDLKKTTNILCFGDSIIELEASHKLKEIFADAYIKTIKFKENPQPQELIKELTIILNQFNDIISKAKNLSIKVSKKKNE